VHVSLGPSCLSAGVLKGGNLRRFSLPLDWAQSGGGVLEDLLRLSPEQFFYAHIYYPNIRLGQAHAPSDENKNTAPLVATSSVYGYPYYYNPHRSLPSQEDYYLRCLKRFGMIITCHDTIHLRFLLADQADRLGECYLNDVFGIAKHVENALSVLPTSKTYDIRLCRISRRHGELLPDIQRKVISARTELVEIILPEMMDDWSYEGLVAKIVYPRCTSLPYQRQLLEDPLR